MDVPLSTLRVLREVADRRSFTAAAETLGYTQSAVSRQVAVAEREVGAELFQRSWSGVVPTRAGQVLLRGAARALEALEAAEREIADQHAPTVEVRLGCIPLVAGAMLADLLGRLRDARLLLSTRDGSSPSLVRGLRAGTLDLGVLTLRAPYRSPDQEEPALVLHELAVTRLVLAVPAHGRLAGLDAVHIADLADVPWVGSPGTREEPSLGVWPGLPQRAQVRHVTRDWKAKMALVAAGAGITTVPEMLVPALPGGVAAVRLHGVPEEARRIVAAHLPELSVAGRVVLDALKATARGLYRG